MQYNINMLTTKLISVMKQVKDRMDNPMPVTEMNQLLDVLKTTGATHIEVASVMGHPNFVSVSKQWADAIHARGMKVTWRCAHQNMEGLYGQQAYVGANRKPLQFWIDEAVRAVKALGPGIVVFDDEWAIYPERTEGIFQDSTAWISGGLPGSYAQFFIDMNEACGRIFQSMKIGLSANNASELLSTWMPRSLIDYATVAVVDHYRDGDPALYESEIRSINSKYGKPVYVQEGAPDRFNKPTRAQADAYFAVNKKLADEGILVGFGSWSGWTGTPEAILDLVNGKYVLNDQGLSLQAWWLGSGGMGSPPEPAPQPTTQSIVIGPEEPYKSGYKTYFRDLTIDGKLVGKIKTHRK